MAEPAAAADPVLVEQALREAGAATDRPGLSAAAYFADLGEAVARGIGWLLESLIDAAGGAVSGEFLVGALGLSFALAVLLLVFLLLRLGLKRTPRSRPVELAAASAAPELPPGADWEAEVEARLVRGEIRPALEALWWWLADRLSGLPSPTEPAAATGGRPAQPSWTTRELVQRAGRRDLLRAVVPLDRFLYADAHPSAADVRGLLGQLRGVLDGPAGEGGR